MKRGLFSIIATVFCLFSVFSPLNASAQSASGVNCDEYYDFISLNDDRGFYNPCASAGGACSTGGGTLTSPAPSELKGENNAEKVWNYFTGRGLTPMAAAAAMGNIEQESGFDPWIGEGGSTNINKSELQVGFGLIQWTNTEGNTQGRRYQVMKYLEDNGVRLDATDLSQNDKALLYELNFLWDVEYGKLTWQEPVNAEQTIDGATLTFHSLVERSADNAAQLQERVDSAKAFLERFGAGGGECSIGEGGLTFEQAEKLMKYYIDDPNAASVPGMAWFFNSGPSSCPGKPNCTAFSTYFVGKFTNLQANAMGNGGEKVDTLLGLNPGAESGSTPKPFAVFQTSGSSSAGHTGVILGIQGDEVIIGEASCGDEIAGIKARKITIQEASSGYKYMYTDTAIKADVIKEVIGG